MDVLPRRCSESDHSVVIGSLLWTGTVSETSPGTVSAAQNAPEQRWRKSQNQLSHRWRNTQITAFNNVVEVRVRMAPLSDPFTCCICFVGGFCTSEYDCQALIHI